jgi:hypothetical protein
MRLSSAQKCAILRSMMSIRDQITLIERRAEALGVEVRNILLRAGVHRATWDRWKSGSNGPRFSTWESVLAAASEFGCSPVAGATPEPMQQVPANA